MPLIRTHRQARSAFSLIELLIVIAIIALLVGLTTAAVQRVRIVAVRTQTANDITKLADGLQAAMKRYNDATVLPSKLVLFNQLNRYTTNPPVGETPADTELRKRSGETLSRMFGPRLLRNGTYVSWDGAASPADSKTVLEGQQCLVFYLGGVQVTTGSALTCVGFSTDPLNPMKLGGERNWPFFDFKSARLLSANAPFAFGTNAFFVYLDPYRKAGDPLAKPFVYFSTTNAPNNYSPYGSSDCPSLGIAPYQSAAGFVNPSGFQIVSAGENGKFGIGGTTFDPKFGSSDPDTIDNQTNFSQTVLAAPQN